MRLCYGCLDPECGDNDKVVTYEGVVCLTCKKVPADQMRFYSSKTMAERDLARDPDSLIADLFKFKDEFGGKPTDVPIPYTGVAAPVSKLEGNMTDENQTVTEETTTTEPPIPAAPDPIAPLSAREREVFFYLIDGFKNHEIAKKLFISPRTVETHRARILQKLDCKTTVHLARYACRHGLLLP